MPPAFSLRAACLPHAAIHSGLRRLLHDRAAVRAASDLSKMTFVRRNTSSFGRSRYSGKYGRSIKQIKYRVVSVGSSGRRSTGISAITGLSVTAELIIKRFHHQRSQYRQRTDADGLCVIVQLRKRERHLGDDLGAVSAPLYLGGMNSLRLFPRCHPAKIHGLPAARSRLRSPRETSGYPCRAQSRHSQPGNRSFSGTGTVHSG